MPDVRTEISKFHIPSSDTEHHWQDKKILLCIAKIQKASMNSSDSLKDPCHNNGIDIKRP